MTDTISQAESPRACGLGCELPAGHEGQHDDLGGGRWPQEAPEQPRFSDEVLAERVDKLEERVDEIGDRDRDISLLIRALAGALAKADPDGLLATRGDKPGCCDLAGQLGQLLGAGYRVEFSTDPEGYVASAGDHDAIADSPAAALAAVAAMIQGTGDEA